MSYTISGGFSTKDPDSMKKIVAAVEEQGGKIGLPFTATGWKSEYNAHLVTGEKAPVEKETLKKKIEKLDVLVKKTEKKIINEEKKPVKKKEVKKDTGDTTVTSIRGSPFGSKKKTSRTWSKSRE